MLTKVSTKISRHGAWYSYRSSISCF